MTETKLREDIVRFAQSLFARGLTSGSSGNISVRVDDGWLMTPTGSSLGTLDPALYVLGCGQLPGRYRYR
jgi:ribulose-5-phosphate 4-epimerase/fuculose-1-phosphate aldolase